MHKFILSINSIAEDCMVQMETEDILIFIFKVAIVGTKGVGKTSMMLRFSQGKSNWEFA